MLVHLHGHGEYSLLDAVGTAEERAARAAALGQPAISLTDHAVLCGQMHHRRACIDPKKGVGIVPIHGVEAYFRPSRTPHDKSNWQLFHMVLLVKNTTGWNNLRLLTSEAYRTGFYRRPCIDLDLLAKHHDGLICSTSCFQGWVPQAILAGDMDEARRRALVLESFFGDDLYFAIQPHDFDDQRLINTGIVNLGMELGKPIVAESDEHYVLPGHEDVQDVKLMMQTKQTYATRQQKLDDEEKIFEFHAKTLYISSEFEMAGFFATWHEHIPPHIVDQSIDNTMEIASRCPPFSIDQTDKLPVYFDKAPGDVPNDYRLLRELAYAGLDAMQKADDSVYIERLERELKMFHKLGIVSFFLITADMCRRAAELGIARGPARGSAGGSLACRCLGITIVDPIPYKLKFERFLNENRVGIPDIDLDFDPQRVVELEDYMMDKYGRERVVNLISFQRFGARRVLGDVGRVFDIPFEETRAVTKKIDDKMTDEPLADIRLIVPEVDRWAEAHPKAWWIAQILQGEVAGFGEHPAGLVIGDRDLDQRLPLMKKAKDDDYLVTAFDEGADYPIISKLGFLKIDMLRIKELTKHQYALDIIEKRHGIRPKLAELPPVGDPYAVDDRVMENFRKGLLFGVWTFGASPGNARLLRQVKPENILHLAAVQALYRPAVLEKGMHENYVKRRHGEEEWQHWHPSVAPFLDDTYGVLTFQEQIMDLAVALGGFTLTEADDVRSVISKEYRQKGDKANARLEAMRQRFVDHACNVLGLSMGLAEEIWDLVGGFSGYSFNLAHAVAYALLSYMDMWLKTYYPDAFYAAMLSFPPSGKKGDEDRKVLFYERTIREARVLGVDVLPPDVNDSDGGFTVTADGIRFGLEQIKGIGPAAGADLVKHRPYESIEDIQARCEKVNRGTIKALAQSGALDRFGVRDHLSIDERAGLEDEYLKTAISTQDRIRRFAPFLEERVNTEDEIIAMPHQSPVLVGGELISGEERQIQNGPNVGSIYVNLTIAFGANTWKCRLWSGVYQKAKPVLDLDEPILLRGWWDAAWGNIVVEEVILCRDLYTPPPDAPRPISGQGITGSKINAEVLMAA